MAGIGILQIQAMPGPDPESASRILIEGVHVVAAEAGGVGWIVPVHNDLAGGRIQPLEPETAYTDPQRTGRIFMKSPVIVWYGH